MLRTTKMLCGAMMACVLSLGTMAVISAEESRETSEIFVPGHVRPSVAIRTMEAHRLSGSHERAVAFGRTVLQRSLEHRSKLKLTWQDYEAMWQIAVDAGDDASRQEVVEAWLIHLAEQDGSEPRLFGRELLRLSEAMLATGIGDPAQMAEIGRSILNDQPAVSVTELLDVYELGRLTNSETLREQSWTRLAGLARLQGSSAKQMLPGALGRLAEIHRRNGESEEFERICQFVVEEYLSEPGLSEAILGAEWVQLVEVVSNSENAHLRAKMAERVQQEMAQRQVRAVSLEQLKRLAAISDWLDRDNGQLLEATLICQWLDLGDSWGQLNADLRRQLKEAVVGSDVLRWQRLEAVLQERSLVELEALVTAAARCGEHDLARKWTQSSLKRLQLGAAPQDIEAIAGMFAASRLRLEDEQSTHLLNVIISVGDQSWQLSDTCMESVARAIGSGATHHLQGALVDASGSVNLAVAKVLAWQQRHAGKSRPFVVELVALRDKATGDERARRELTVAYAVSLVRERGVRRTDGNAHIDLALAEADSEAVLVLCLAELAVACGTAGIYDHPLQVIQSMQHQVGGDSGEQVSALVERLLRDQASRPDHDEALNEASAQWRRVFQRQRGEMVRDAVGLVHGQGQQ